MTFNACPISANALPCSARAIQLPKLIIILGILCQIAPLSSVTARTNDSSVRRSWRTRVIINENDNTAADHENQFAEALVPRIASVVAKSLLLLLKAIPKKLPAVANPWLAEIDTEMVMVVMKDTIWRYAVNGGVFGFRETGEAVPFDAGSFCTRPGGGAVWIDEPETPLKVWFADIGNQSVRTGKEG